MYMIIPPAPSSDWKPTVASRIRAIDATLTRMGPYSNGVNLAGDMTLNAATGTGTVLPSTAEGGAARVSSGATAGGVRVANLGSGISGFSTVTNSRTSHWAVYMKAKIITAVASGAEVATMCCLEDSTNDNFLGQSAATSTTNWVLSIGAVDADTGVAFDTSWHELVLYNNGTTITAYVDWVAIATGASAGLATTQGWARTHAYNAAVNGTVNYDFNRWALFSTDP